MTFINYFTGQFSAAQEIDFFIRIILACICGALIGFERSKRLKEAGIRTHVIVCCAAALIMIISKYGFTDLVSTDNALYGGTRGADPARIAAQAISGISFLGAGVIFRNGSTVKGLTTAAGIWATAAIGLSIGAGMFITGILFTAVISLMQIIMHKITVGRDSLAAYRIKFTVLKHEEFQKHFNTYIAEHQIQIFESRITCDTDGTIIYDTLLRAPIDVNMQEFNMFIKSGEVSGIYLSPAV